MVRRDRGAGGDRRRRHPGVRRGARRDQQPRRRGSTNSSPCSGAGHGAVLGVLPNADPLTGVSSAHANGREAAGLAAVRAVVPLAIGSYAAYAGAALWWDARSVDVQRELPPDRRPDREHPNDAARPVLRLLLLGWVSPRYFDQMTYVIPMLMITPASKPGFFRRHLRDPDSTGGHRSGGQMVMSLGLVGALSTLPWEGLGCQGRCVQVARALFVLTLQGVHRPTSAVAGRPDPRGTGRGPVVTCALHRTDAPWSGRSCRSRFPTSSAVAGRSRRATGDSAQRPAIHQISLTITQTAAPAPRAEDNSYQPTRSAPPVSRVAPFALFVPRFFPALPRFLPRRTANRGHASDEDRQAGAAAGAPRCRAFGPDGSLSRRRLRRWWADRECRRRREPRRSRRYW